jgi:diguanylate cyclase (GGDEF)-like protein/PAS domain S-box-containing protein
MLITSSLQSATLRPLRFIFGGLVSVLFIAYVSALYKGWNDTLEDTSNELEAFTALLQNNAQTAFKNHEIVLRGLGEQLIEMGALFAPAYGQDFIERLGLTDEDMRSIALVWPNGQVVLKTGFSTDADLPNLADSPHTRDDFRRAAESGRWAIGRPAQYDQDWLVPFYVPLHDMQQELIALLVAEYRVDHSVGVDQQPMPEHIESAILRSDGYLQFFYPLPEEVYARQEIYAQPLEAYILTQVESLPSGSGFSQIDFGERGGNHLVHYRQSADQQLTYGTFIPVAVLVDRWVSAITIPTIVFLITALGGFGVYWYAARQQLSASRTIYDMLSWQDAILNGVDYAIISTDTDGIITSINRAGQRMLGYECAEIVNKNSLTCFHDEAEINEQRVANNRELTPVEVVLGKATKGRAEEREWTYIRKDGTRFPVLVSISSVFDVKGRISGYVGIASDISQRKADAEVLEFQATHDSLTGLPNRDLLHKDFIHRVVRPRFNKAALMLLDLNGFKEINDTLGHAIGDKLLNRVGPRLEQAMLEHGGTVYRLGGDEFAILIPVVKDQEMAMGIAREAGYSLKESFHVDKMSMAISGSIGVSMFPEHGRNSHDLLRAADVAMYSAKRDHTSIEAYREALDPYTKDRLHLMTDFKEALDENQLILHYQPKYDLDEGRVVGFEALVRWQHPERGLIYPDTFVPLIELSDNIHPMTLKVLTMALKQQRAWEKAGFDYSVAVNLSSRNLMETNCVWQLRRPLEEYEVNPEKLEIEITETSVMSDPDAGARRLQRLREAGIKLTLDDFGTGYSSLGQLRNMPFDTIKIDRSFVTNMIANPHDEAIVRATLDMGRAMNVKVVAEGVETPEVLFRLSELGCDYIQGFFVGRPLSAEESFSLDVDDAIKTSVKVEQ